MEQAKQYTSELITKDLSRQITEKQFEIGAHLPTEKELCEQYQCSRMTVRRALQTLTDQGLIVRHRGKRSKVVRNRKTVGLLSLQGFSELSKKLNVDQWTDLLSATQWVEIPADLKTLFEEANEFDSVIGVFRKRGMDKEAVMIEHTYIAGMEMTEADIPDFSTTSIFQFLDHACGVEIMKVNQAFQAIACTAEIAAHLEVSVGFPILRVDRVLHTNDPNVVLFSTVYCKTEHFLISV
ncbi:GntR family transcriptional regulator [Persicobacter diffluens]|uniref:GntR family transcriptional regulator n=1 Tax=Persicobacter diffluens TaxID=981 RepID=A0AAN5AN59_9BACT|nr:GntR family transcriptional regulator [Persicobacter diffluens]